MANPVRSRILMALAETVYTVPVEDAAGTSLGLTVRQVAERLNEPRRKIRYHLDILCDQGLVEIAELRARKGVIERSYAPTRLLLFEADEVAQLPLPQQKMIILGVLRAVFSDASTALEEGTYVRRPEWSAVRSSGQVDEKGWQELGELHLKLSRDTLKVLESAGKRLRETKSAPIRVGAANFLFEAAPLGSGVKRSLKR